MTTTAGHEDHQDGQDAAIACSHVIALTIPGEPTGKERPRVNTKTGAVYTPRATKEAEATIGWEVKRAASEQGVPLPFVGPVRVRFAFRSAVPADATVGLKDGDNLEKLAADALNHVAYADDRQVVEMHWTLERGSVNPGIDIMVEQLGMIVVFEESTP